MILSNAPLKTVLNTGLNIFYVVVYLHRQSLCGFSYVTNDVYCGMAQAKQTWKTSRLRRESTINNNNTYNIIYVFETYYFLQLLLTLASRPFNRTYCQCMACEEDIRRANMIFAHSFPG